MVYKVQLFLCRSETEDLLILLYMQISGGSSNCSAVFVYVFKSQCALTIRSPLQRRHDFKMNIHITNVYLCISVYIHLFIPDDK